jgi:hypothetical protein
MRMVNQDTKVAVGFCRYVPHPGRAAINGRVSSTHGKTKLQVRQP